MYKSVSFPGRSSINWSCNDVPRKTSRKGGTVLSPGIWFNTAHCINQAQTGHTGDSKAPDRFQQINKGNFLSDPSVCGSHVSYSVHGDSVDRTSACGTRGEPNVD